MNRLCKDWRDRLHLYAEGELDARKRRALREHVRCCGLCRRYLARYEAFTRSLLSGAGCLREDDYEVFPESAFESRLREDSHRDRVDAIMAQIVESPPHGIFRVGALRDGGLWKARAPWEEGLVSGEVALARLDGAGATRRRTTWRLGKRLAALAAAVLVGALLILFSLSERESGGPRIAATKTRLRPRGVHPLYTMVQDEPGRVLAPSGAVRESLLRRLVASRAMRGAPRGGLPVEVGGAFLQVHLPEGTFVLVGRSKSLGPEVLVLGSSRRTPVFGPTVSTVGFRQPGFDTLGFTRGPSDELLFLELLRPGAALRDFSTTPVSWGGPSGEL